MKNTPQEKKAQKLWAGYESQNEESFWEKYDALTKISQIQGSKQKQKRLKPRNLTLFSPFKYLALSSIATAITILLLHELIKVKYVLHVQIIIGLIGITFCLTTLRHIYLITIHRVNPRCLSIEYLIQGKYQEYRWAYIDYIKIKNASSLHFTLQIVYKSGTSNDYFGYLSKKKLERFSSELRNYTKVV